MKRKPFYQQMELNRKGAIYPVGKGILSIAKTMSGALAELSRSEQKEIRLG